MKQEGQPTSKLNPNPCSQTNIANLGSEAVMKQELDSKLPYLTLFRTAGQTLLTLAVRPS